ncbi:hypothetical protein QFZ58_005026 [Streptomyces sp. B1I3]|nr:hypothetical protein [Streptomyces sp. B1I3]
MCRFPRPAADGRPHTADVLGKGQVVDRFTLIRRPGAAPDGNDAERGSGGSVRSVGARTDLPEDVPASVEAQVGELPFERGDVILGLDAGRAGGHERCQLAARPSNARGEAVGVLVSP